MQNPQANVCLLGALTEKTDGTRTIEIHLAVRIAFDAFLSFLLRKNNVLIVNDIMLLMQSCW